MALLDQLASCTRLCDACRHLCRECAEACRSMPDMQNCVDLNVRCAEFCDETIRTMARGSVENCEACAEACDRCAEECEKYGEEACYECAQVCRRCEHECRELAALGLGGSKYTLQ
ncbi:MAG TPA: four-helix bundle copper-binding protein [Fimbriimonadaceae bacterium]|nr:four-helix bundle copper-binding protein [Fimbriimonadaceae bacterium]